MADSYSTWNQVRLIATGAWTVNEASDMRVLAELGVDAICTDRPDRLMALLERYNPSNKAVER